LEKGRAGEEPPAFIVEVIYFQRVDAWDKEGRARLELPALDLPVASNAVALHFSPRYRIELYPGTFRLADDIEPLAAVFRDGRRTPPPPPPQPQQGKLQELVDRFRNESAGRTVAGILPVHVTFPAFGPSIFLRAELTAESQMPSIELAFEKRGGL
jgi:hypothetical protein